MVMLVLVMLRNFLRRYEQFRGEAAELFDNTFANLRDINQRLTAAGFPPNLVQPASTYPLWASQGLDARPPPAPSPSVPQRVR
jgi:hypothetical protein